MGISAAVIGGALTSTTAVAVGAGIVGGMALSNMGKKGGVMQMPMPPGLDPAGNQRKAEGAEGQQRKRAMAAGATGSTILTGPQGLGDLPDANKSAKNLLGY